MKVAAEALCRWQQRHYEGGSRGTMKVAAEAL